MRHGTHYETLPHSDCGDPQRCDCCCRACFRKKAPDLLKEMEDRGFTISARGEIWHTECLTAAK